MGRIRESPSPPGHALRPSLASLMHGHRRSKAHRGTPLSQCWIVCRLRTCMALNLSASPTASASPRSTGNASAHLTANSLTTATCSRSANFCLDIPTNTASTPTVHCCPPTSRRARCCLQRKTLQINATSDAMARTWSYGNCNRTCAASGAFSISKPIPIPKPGRTWPNTWWAAG